MDLLRRTFFFFFKNTTFVKSGTFGLFFGTASSLSSNVLWLQRIIPPHPLYSPCTYSLACFLTIIWFLGSLAFCRQALVGGVVQFHRFDNNLVPRPAIHLVLVLMQVVARVGQGGQGHGKGWKVGKGSRREEGGGDAKRPRQHRSCGKAQSLKFRLLQTFRFRSSVLEPDLYLPQNYIKQLSM